MPLEEKRKKKLTKKKEGDKKVDTNSIGLGRFRVCVPVDVAKEELRVFSHEMHNWVAGKLQEMEDKPVTDFVAGMGDGDLAKLYQLVLDNGLRFTRALGREVRWRGRVGEVEEDEE